MSLAHHTKKHEERLTFETPFIAANNIESRSMIET